MKKLALLLFFLILPVSVYGYDQEKAVNNFSHDLATCSAYYYLFSESPDFGEENRGQGLLTSKFVVFFPDSSKINLHPLYCPS